MHEGWMPGDITGENIKGFGFKQQAKTLTSVAYFIISVIGSQ